MAKEQNLVLNPQKVSGVCGRLLCCLTYEDKTYREASKNMPKMGRLVTTPDGQGRVRDRDVLNRRVRVQLEEENAINEYAVDQLQSATSEKRAQKQPDTTPDRKSHKKKSNERTS
jgi:cell fate regulator YaaT (PSP1 superfamily)